MKKKIYLYWFKYDKGKGNFGDELNPYLIKRLSGQCVEFYDIRNDIELYNFKERVHKLIFSKDRINFLHKIIQSLIKRQNHVLIAIGSIIGWYRNKNIIVWGSGIMKRSEKINPAEFCAVRGRYTQERLKEFGYTPPEVIGDPALLLPLVYPLNRNKIFEIGIIPHFVHYDLLNDINKRAEIKIINLLDSIEKVTDDINSCKLTLSTSLHGIIVSHAYNIPSRWVTFDETLEEKLSGDNIKFWDYFSSVDIPEMEVLNMGSVNNNELVNKANNEFFLNPDEFLPKAEKIKAVQKDLIEVAPFPIKKEYKNDN